MKFRRGYTVSGAFVFLLLGMFAVLAAVLVVMGAQAYRSTVQNTEWHNEHRILRSVIVNAVQADDARGAVTVEEVDGMDVLHIAYDFDGEGYGKWLYVSEGQLRELFTADAYGFDPAAGEPLCPAGDLQLTREGSLITAVITDEHGCTQEAQIALRCID